MTPPKSRNARTLDGHDGDERQPGPLAGVAEQQAEHHPGRAGGQVPVTAVGGAEADDADHGEHDQRDRVDELVAAGDDRARATAAVRPRCRWRAASPTPSSHAPRVQQRRAGR